MSKTRSADHSFAKSLPLNKAKLTMLVSQNIVVLLGEIPLLGVEEGQLGYSVDSSPNRNTNKSYYQKKIYLRQLMKATVLRILEGHLSHGTQIESAHDPLPHGDIILTLHKWLTMELLSMDRFFRHQSEIKLYLLYCFFCTFKWHLHYVLQY